jgi:hypothetical protein
VTWLNRWNFPWVMQFRQKASYNAGPIDHRNLTYVHQQSTWSQSKLSIIHKKLYKMSMYVPQKLFIALKYLKIADSQLRISFTQKHFSA